MLCREHLAICPTSKNRLERPVLFPVASGTAAFAVVCHGSMESAKRKPAKRNNCQVETAKAKQLARRNNWQGETSSSRFPNGSKLRKLQRLFVRPSQALTVRSRITNPLPCKRSRCLQTLAHSAVGEAREVRDFPGFRQDPAVVCVRPFVARHARERYAGRPSRSGCGCVAGGSQLPRRSFRPCRAGPGKAGLAGRDRERKGTA